MKAIELKLEDHSRELEQAGNILNKVSKEFKWYKETKVDIPHRKKFTLVYLTSKVLDLVGELSMTRFDVRDSLEEKYKIQYCKSPELGKKLYLEHYESIHKPYDKIKNKCFELLGRIDPKNEIEFE